MLDPAPIVNTGDLVPFYPLNVLLSNNISPPSNKVIDEDDESNIQS